MKLNRHLSRLEDTIRSRQEIAIDHLSIRRAPRGGNRAYFTARLRFFDGSFLVVREELEVRSGVLHKVAYVYHYQASDRLIFRYDNAPHHPEVSTFPHHKHVGERVVPGEEPDFHRVLREIDAILYPNKGSDH